MESNLVKVVKVEIIRTIDTTNPSKESECSVSFGSRNKHGQAINKQYIHQSIESRGPKKEHNSSFISISVTRFGEIPPLWQIFKNLWQHVQGVFGFGHSF